MHILKIKKLGILLKMQPNFRHLQTNVKSRATRAEAVAQTTITPMSQAVQACFMQQDWQNPQDTKPAELRRMLTATYGFILHTLGIKNSHPCGQALSENTNTDTLLRLQMAAEQLNMLASRWQSQPNPQLQEMSKELKNIAFWLGSILPTMLDGFLIIALVAYIMRVMVLMLVGSVWCATLFAPSKQAMASSQMVKELLQVVCYLPLIVCGYFLSHYLLNLLLPFALQMTMKNLSMNLYSQDYIGLDTLKHQAMLLALMGSVMTLMCAQAIFLLPQTLARVLGFSDGDYAVTAASNTYDNNASGRTGMAHQAGRSPTSLEPPSTSIANSVYNFTRHAE